MEQDKLCEGFRLAHTMIRVKDLEQSLKFGQRNSGHFVQGHVDASCKVNKIVTLGKSWIITINLPKKYKKPVILK